MGPATHVHNLKKMAAWVQVVSGMEGDLLTIDLPRSDKCTAGVELHYHYAARLLHKTATARVEKA